MSLQPYEGTGVPVERQSKILDVINNDPFGSYVFSGPPGVGKTTFLKESLRLSRLARNVNHPTYFNTMPRIPS
jgi:replication-associated recombination protein RarA